VCREITEQHGVDTDFAADESLPAIDPDVALCLYRVTQEALYNVLRHSGTRQASVELRCDGGGLTLRIADQGVGFDVDAAERAGLGLVSMRERVNLLGGTLTIQSTPGRGTWIVVSVSASLLGIHSKLA
jgi:signal transduction histidine kinase